MTVDRIGYGAGQKDFPQPNVLRILVGEVVSADTGRQPYAESIVLLETNLDDAGGEAVGHAVERLWGAGALDVSLTAIQMKKNRPGILVSVQAQPSDADRLESILFQETPTLGVRRTTVQRSVLSREPHAVQTRLGRVAGKIAHLPDGSARSRPNTTMRPAWRKSTEFRWPKLLLWPSRHFDPPRAANQNDHAPHCRPRRREQLHVQLVED